MHPKRLVGQARRMSHARDAFYIPYYTHLIFDSCFLCSILVQRVMFFVFHLDPASITRERMSNTTLARLGRVNKNMSAQIMPLVPGIVRAQLYRGLSCSVECRAFVVIFQTAAHPYLLGPNERAPDS
jgi:hypothetical protein